LCHSLGGDDLKGEGHCGYQSKDGVDNSRLAKTSRAKESRNRNVVSKVDRRRQARTREQYNTSRDNAPAQRLRLLGQVIHRTRESP